MRVVTPTVFSARTAKKSSSSEGLEVATKKFLDTVKRDKGLTSHEDWYSIKQQDLVSYQEFRLLQKYHSLSEALKVAYPHEQWLPWKFVDGIPRGFFHSKDNQQQFLDWFSKKHNITKLDDWYNFKYIDIDREGGGSLLFQYNGSLIGALKHCYPEHDWKEWNFTGSTTKSYWKNRENRKAYFDWLAQQLGYTKPDDWYKLTFQKVEKLHGRTVIEHYYGCVQAAVQDLYPEIDFKPWLFQSVPRGYWDNIHHRRQFMDWAAMQLNITMPDDWYRIHCADLYPLGGKTLINRFRGSLMQLLVNTYPETNWVPWKFNALPAGTKQRYCCNDSGFWNDEHNIQSFLSYVMHSYDIKPNEIFSLTTQNWRDAGGSALLKQYRGLNNIIKKYLPHLQLPERDRQMSKGQFRLQKVVESLFPGKQVLPNHRIADNAEVDIFVPDVNLAIEYQGEYHYQWDYIIGSSEEVQHRDQRKRDLCEQLHIHLIEIPFWWDRHKLSVAATIRQKLPDLHMAIQIPPDAKPISSVIPKSVAKNTARQQMRAMDSGSLQSFGVWNANQPATGRLLVVAPAGQRCLWDGQAFVDHLNKPLHIPDSFSKELPSNVNIEFVLHTSSEGPQLTAIDINSFQRSYTTRINELRQILPSHINIVNPIVCTEAEQHKLVKNQCMKDGKLLLVFHPSSEKSMRSFFAFIDVQTMDLLDESLKPSWTNTAEGLPYSLHTGPRSKCRSCQKEFQREDVRLLAHGVFVAMDSRPYKVKFSLCLTPECINKAVNKSNSKIVFPPFDNRISVPSYLKDKGVEQKLDQLKDAELVFQE